MGISKAINSFVDGMTHSAEEAFREWWAKNSEVGHTHSAIGFHAFTSGYASGRSIRDGLRKLIEARMDKINPSGGAGCYITSDAAEYNSLWRALAQDDSEKKEAGDGH